MMPDSAAMSRTREAWLIPSAYMMSNSACLKGGATLFFTTFTRTCEPTTSSFSHCRNSTDVETHRRIELERLSASRRLRISEHHADLLSQLVDEDHRRPRSRDRAGKLSQRLTHQPSLKSHVRLAHVAFYLGAGYQRGNGIDDDHIHRSGANEDFANLHRLLAGIRLRDEEIVDVHAQLLRVIGVERMLGVDVRGNSACALRVGNNVKAKRGLAARLGSVNLRNAAARNTPDSNCCVEVDCARRDGVDSDAGGFRSHLHDRTFPAGFLDLRDR